MSYIGSSPKVNRLRLNPRATDPVNPSEGDLQYADGSAREEGVWVYKNSAWVKVGSDQAGDINYITNGDAEAGSTAGWSLGNVTLTSAFPSGTPTFGSGANANLSFTNTTVTPLAGTRSFLYASSAATTAGNFVASDAFTVDLADRARVLQIAFNYQLVSGTANFSGTSSNSFGIAIYDVTAAQWIMPAGVWNLVQSSGVGKATATFQTSATSTQYRLVLFNANATSGAVSLELDRISVGPQKQVLAPAMSDWVSYTPTVSGLGSGSLATNSAKWRRVGDSLEVEIYSVKDATNGTGAAAVTWTVPAGFSVDLNKLGSAVSSHFNLIGNIVDTQSGYTGSLVYEGGVIKAYAVTALTGVWVGSSFSANKAVSLRFAVPITGFSSNSVMSNDTDTRVVAASVFSTTQINATNAYIVFPSVRFDTSGAYDVATGIYTCPVSGFYRVSANDFTNGGTVQWYLHKNGVQFGPALVWQAAGTPANGTVIVNCNAGDTLRIWGQTLGVSGTTYYPQVFFERLSGPAVVAATETVSCRYTKTDATAFSGGAVRAFNIRDFDTHAAYNTSTGLFTAPVSGKYLVVASVQSAVSSYSPGNTQRLYFNVNGSIVWGSEYIYPNSSSSATHLTASTVVNLLAGQTVGVVTDGSIVNNFTADGTRNSLSITRLGN